MQSTIKILDTPVIFTYSLEIGQTGNWDQEDIPTQIIDLDWEQELYSKAVNECIDNDLDFVYAEIWEELVMLKKEALYEKAVNDFEGGFQI